MKVLNVNFQSVKNKKEEIGNLINSVEPGIITGTETCLNSAIHSSEIFPANYDVIRHDRKDGYGGVLRAIRKDYVFEKVDVESNTESVFAKLTLDKNKTLIIGSLYRPPSSDARYMEDLCSTIQDIGQKYKNAVIRLGGDLNLPDINWNTCSVDGNQNPAQINNKFLGAIQNCSLEQKVTCPTRKESTLDLFLTNRPSLVNRCTTLPGIGDHDIVFLESSVSAKRSKLVKRKIYLWKRADTDKLKKEPLTFQHHFLETYTTQVSCSGHVGGYQI